MRVYRAVNVHASPLKFEIDPQELLELYNAIEDGGQELGAIYHSHVRSEPYPSQTDINFAANWPGVEWIIVGLAARRGAEVRSYLIDGGEVREVGASRSVRLMPTRRSRSSVRAARARYPPSERFCEACGMPLVLRAGRRAATASERQRKARKIKPQYAEGELVKVARVANQPEAEFIRGCCSRRGSRACCAARSAGYAPVAGPRDVLVPESGAEAAREALAWDEPETSARRRPV